MIERVLSPAFRQTLRNAGPGRFLEGVEKWSESLMAAALHLLQERVIIWLLPRERLHKGLDSELGRWLELLGRPGAGTVTLTLPFTDPGLESQPDLEALSARGRLLHLLSEKKLAVVATSMPVLNTLFPAAGNADLLLEMKTGNDFPRPELIERSLSLGYRSCDLVAEKGEISWRGNVLDLFPLNLGFPVRIEFAGDRIVSLRLFDPETQRSIEETSQVVVYPARFFPASAGEEIFGRPKPPEKVFLTDLLPDHLLVFSDYARQREELDRLQEDIQNRRLESPGENRGRALQPELFSFPWSDRPGLRLLPLHSDPRALPELLRWPGKALSLRRQEIEELRTAAENEAVVLCGATEEQAEKVRRFLSLDAVMPDPIPQPFLNKSTATLFLNYQSWGHSGELPATLPGIRTERWLDDINDGDLVVHRRHGIGVFRGLRRIKAAGEEQDFLQVEYLRGEFLYLPLWEVDQLGKYKALPGQNPVLDRLGGRSWRQKQERVRKSLVEYAGELLQLYALRQARKGFSYSRVAEFEDEIQRTFPFLETADQQKAIRDVLQDLESDRPMDRLLCGDVSFGKTEVAVRAALRVLAHGRQVALLCPTTILARQHWLTFSERFSGMPFKLAIMSRMVSAAELAETRKKLAAGEVDLVIGTHALLSKKLVFRDLGLLIIDEEQRFGVFQKENLKQGRENVDVLTLSATPIPRTLSMTMAGLQDVSLLDTPPLGRLAVRNFVGYFSRQVLTSAIRHELQRGGKVFVVYNDIDSILDFRNKVAEWLPETQIAVVHARLNPAQIEEKLASFIEGRCPLLLTTTIIENGLDIAGVNTLVVIDADRFGLTQLYQLRGRVGRGNCQGFAYFLVRRESGLSGENAEMRLQGIRKFSELGAGYKLAWYDLQLRGGGALLGSRQHGHVAALGFDYYLEMLQRTVSSMRGLEQSKTELELRVHFQQQIDSGFVPSERERIRLYRSMLQVNSLPELELIRTEVNDRYGAIPGSMELVFCLAAVRCWAAGGGWSRVEVFPDRLQADDRDGRSLEIGFSGFQDLLETLSRGGERSRLKSQDRVDSN